MRQGTAKALVVIAVVAVAMAVAVAVVKKNSVGNILRTEWS